MGRVKPDDDVQLAVPDEEPDGPLLFATNVARLRAQRGWSEPMLAQKVGVSEAELSRLLDGRAMPPLEVVWKLANALRVPITTLLRPMRSGL